MKRSQNVVLPQMRKNWRNFSLAPVSVAVASAMLAGCSDDKTQTSIYGTIDDCIDDHPNYAYQCKSAYQEALVEAEKTSPKYKTLDNCAHEFGYSGCVETPNNSWFMPAMTGFMFARLLNNNNQNYYSQPMFSSTNPSSHYYNTWISSDGYNYGSKYSKGKVYVTKDEMKPKPAVKRTISRGGFGSTVSAKSSWSSSKSSSSSWGG